MVNRLVVNGCSYMQVYADGGGHEDLASMLQIPISESLALAGSCNSRILRTTMRDSYHNQPTLYVIGLSFLARYEIPSKIPNHVPDGRWLSYNNTGHHTQECDFVPLYNEKDNRNLADFWFRLLDEGLPDVMEDLQYRILSVIHSLKARGHVVMVFNTAENFMTEWSRKDISAPLFQCNSVIDGLRWRSIPWQFEQGARYASNEESLPWDCRHVESGQHRYLNQFLMQWIHDQNLL